MLQDCKNVDKSTYLYILQRVWIRSFLGQSIPFVGMERLVEHWKLIPTRVAAFKSQLVKFEELPLSFPATSVAYIINFFGVLEPEELELEKLLRQTLSLCLSPGFIRSNYSRNPHRGRLKLISNFKLQLPNSPAPGPLLQLRPKIVLRTL